MRYAITCKTKYKTRINISVIYKIIITQTVYLVIRRQYPEVGHKNIFVFGYKNHFGKFTINTR
jgi:hypothetical protein